MTDSGQVLTKWFHARNVVFFLISLMAAYVLYHNESFLLNSTSSFATL